MKIYTTDSVFATEKVGGELAKSIRKNDVVALFGDLGAGKTAFTRGLVRGLGIDAQVSSPTFALVNEYSGGGNKVYHYDMYRITSWDDLYSTGYFDCLQSGSVLVIEWSENIEAALPDDYIRVEIEKNSEENSRTIKTGRGENFENIGD
ncbi:MAG: tRNA (adenosine(37)-N6)-threonylcarbamoyltransferase complex ATPase subunit type 1 TsaE [Clostridia bacterium]|nr:tRNA (adenosine(37)-N6)-threonylcarbamoyltransferase complex ATPase subunit type 1 TsaE [Clostridia bacterium]